MFPIVQNKLLFMLNENNLNMEQMGRDKKCKCKYARWCDYKLSTQSIEHLTIGVRNSITINFSIIVAVQ